MSDPTVKTNTAKTIQDASEGGFSAFHDNSALTHLARVAPTTEQEFNTLVAALIPIACWRLEDLRFAFDSSFILPQAAIELPHLSALRLAHPGARLSIFGHADPTGSDDYNKTLSGRRALAVYGMLTRDVGLWEQLYSTPHGNDHWNLAYIQTILQALGHVPGNTDGQTDVATTDAVKEFQNQNGLTADGDAGLKTREKLFTAYMDAVCGKDLKLDKTTDFLAKGADPQGKGDVQGCSEFNPVLVFSRQEDADYQQQSDHTARDEDNAPNRRVVIFLFRKDVTIDAARWPCPHALEAPAGCRKRFWSDGEKRRSYQEKRRKYEETTDTFACRFYDRLAGRSPCEQPLPPEFGQGFLAVKLFFHRQLMQGLQVAFFQSNGDAAGATPGEAIASPVFTDPQGVASLDITVPLGDYICQIEHQPSILISTVETRTRPYVLVLPIHRPYFDFEGDVEFIA